MDTFFHSLTLKCGQAMVEFAVGVAALVMMLTAIVSFAPAFIRAFEIENTARADAGEGALFASSGSHSAGDGGAYLHHVRQVDDEQVDPWAYPQVAQPQNNWFGTLATGTASPAELVYGTAKKEFHFRFYYNREALVDDEGALEEEVYIPPMEGL